MYFDRIIFLVLLILAGPCYGQAQEPAHTQEQEQAPAPTPEKIKNAANAVSASPAEAHKAMPHFPPIEEEASAINKLGKMIRYLFDFENDHDGPEMGQAGDAQAGVPSGLEEKGVATLQPWMMDVFPLPTLTNTRPWRAQDFSGQVSALGWAPDVFAVPPGMRERVEFWTDIYSRYTTDQGVIHDSIYVDIVYQPVDFSVIMADATTSLFQKHALREHQVDAQKESVIETLKRLQTVKSSENLQGEELRIWKLFEKIEDPLKFQEAAKNGRVRFQLGQKDRFQLGVYYSGRYLRDMENIFRQEGLPIELTRLPFVESSFNIFARSKVGASGIWQFMRRTARPYMTVTREIDERNDPIKATWASAKLLRQNYNMLQTWPLALTGYNHGPYGVRSIVNKLHTRDITEIINTYASRTFGFASENFYACFLAALEVEKHADKYFGKARWSNPVESFEVALRKPLQYEYLLAWFDGNWESAKFFNPHLLGRPRLLTQAIPARSFVRVPLARRAVAEDFTSGKINAKQMLALVRDAPLPEMPGLTQKGAPLVATGPGVSMQSQPDPAAKVPATLTSGSSPSAASAPVAKSDSGPSVGSALKSVLGIEVRQTENEPGPATAATTTTATTTTSAGAAADVAGAVTGLNKGNVASSVPVVVAEEPEHVPVAPVIYKVRRGDTLTRIAKKFKISIEEIRDANDLGVNVQIRRGQKLRVPNRSRRG